MRYFTTYENSRTKRAQKKSCFLLILRISKSPSVTMCCLNVDLYLSFHKHTPKLPLALSRLSRSLLDRFLNDKTWFFVFSTLYARWVTKGLRDTFFKTGDERDWVCAKSSPNHLRFSDALKNAILCGDITFDFWQLSTSLGYSQWKNMHARLLCIISFRSTCKSYASVSAKSAFFVNIFL